MSEPFEDSRRLTGANLYFSGAGAALETAPGSQKVPEMRFGGPASRAVAVSLDLVLDGGNRFGEAVE